MNTNNPTIYDLPDGTSPSGNLIDMSKYSFQPTTMAGRASAPATRQDVETFNKLKGYINNPAMGFNPSNIYETAARNQGGWELLGKSLVHTLAEFTGGIVEGAGGLLNPYSWAAIASDSATKFERNLLQELGHLMNQGVKDALPIYQTKKAQKGFALADATWWASMFPTVASTAASFVPAAAVLRGTSMLGKTLNVGKGLRAAGKHATAGRVLENVSASIMSRHIDTYRESIGTFEQQYQRHKDLGFSDEEAKRMAGEAASIGMRYGYSNIVFDMVQWGAILRMGNRASKGISTEVAKAVGRKEGFKAIAAAASAVAKKPMSFGVDLGLTAFSEAADEAMIGFWQKEGIYEGDKKNLSKYYDKLHTEHNIMDRFASHMGDRHTWDEAFWGAFGGAGMMIGRAGINKIVNPKSAKDLNDKMADKIITTANNLKNSLAQATELIEQGDPVSAKIILDTMVLGLVDNANSTGSLKVWNELLSNIENATNEELKELGLDATIKPYLKEIKSDLQSAIKSSEVFTTKDYSTPTHKFTDDENYFIGSNITRNTYMIEKLDKRIQELDSQRTEEINQINQIKAQLGTISAQTFTDLMGKNEDKKAKAYTKIAKVNAGVSEALLLQYSTLQDIQSKRVMEMQNHATLAISIAHLENAIKSSNTPELVKNEFKRQLKTSKELLEQSKIQLDDLTKQLEDGDKVREELVNSTGATEVKATKDLYNLIHNVRNTTTANTIASLNNSKDKMTKQLAEFNDAKAVRKMIDEIRKENDDAHKTKLTIAKAQLENLNVGQENEIDEIVKAFPELKTEADAKRKKLKQEAKDINNIKEAGLKAKVNEYNNALNQLDIVLKSNLKLDLAFRSEYDDIKTKEKKTVEEYDAAIKQINTLLATIKGEPKPASTPTTTPTSTSTSTSTPTVNITNNELIDILYNRSLVYTNITSLLSILEAIQNYDIATLANEQDGKNLMIAVKLIQLQAASLHLKLLDIHPLINKTELTIDEIELIATTYAEVKLFQGLMKEHAKLNLLTDHSDFDLAIKGTKNRAISHLLTSLSAALSITYKNVQGFDQYNITNNKAIQTYNTLAKKLLAFDTLAEHGDALEANDLANGTPVNEVLLAIERYVKSITKDKNVKDITFEDLMNKIFTTVKSKDQFLATGKLLKDFYNALHNKGLPSETIKVEEVTVEINEEYYDKILKDNNKHMRYITVPYKEGSYFNFNIFNIEDSDEIKLTPEQSEMFKEYLNLKQGDIVTIKKNAKGEYEMHKGDKPLGVTLSQAYQDFRGFNYRNKNGKFSSFVDSFTVNDYEQLLSNMKFLIDAFNNDNIDDLPLSVKNIILKALNHNNDNKYQIEDLTIERIKLVISPIFYGLDRASYNDLIGKMTLEEIQYNYFKLNSSLAKTNHYTEQLETLLKTIDQVELKIHTISPGQMRYSNQVRDNAIEAGLISDLIPLPSSGKYTIGLRNPNNRRQIINIYTGEEIQAENTHILKNSNNKVIAFITTEIHGKTYLAGIDIGRTSSVASGDFGKKLIKATEAKLLQWFNSPKDTGGFESFLRKYYSYNNDKQKNDIMSIYTHEGAKVFTFTSGQGNQVKLVKIVSSPLDTVPKILIYNDAKDTDKYTKKEFTPDEFAKHIGGTLRGVLSYITKDGKLESLVESKETFTDEITGKTYATPLEFLIDTGAFVTKLDPVVDNNGNPLSVFDPTGSPKATIFATVHMEDAAVKAVPTKAKKTKKSKEDTKSISTEEVIDEYFPEVAVTVDDKSFTDLNEFLEYIASKGEMTYDEFIKAFNDHLNAEDLSLVNAVLSVIYNTPIKFKVSLDPKASNPNATADYSNEVVTIYAPKFFVNASNQTRGKMEQTAIVSHEMLHDLFEAFKVLLDEETLNTLKDELSRIVAEIKNVIPTLTKERQTILNNWIAQIDKADIRGDGWQEVLTYALTNMELAQTLVSIKTKSADRSIVIDFFKKIFDTLAKYIKALLNVDIALEKNTALYDIIAATAVSYDVITKAENDAFAFEDKIQRDINNGIDSSDGNNALDLTAKELYDRMIQTEGNLTPSELALFEEKYDSSFVALKRASENRTTLSEWNDLPLTQLGDVKIFRTLFFNEVNYYLNRFAGTTYTRSNARAGGYEYTVKIPKPTLESSDLTIDTNIKAPGSNFTNIEKYGLRNLYTHQVLKNVSTDGKAVNIPTFRDYKEGNKETIRTLLVSRLEQLKTVDGANVELLDRAIVDMKNPNSETFDTFVMYFNNKLGGEIVDIELWSYENEKDFSEYIEKSFEETDMLRMDVKDKITTYLKFRLAQLAIKRSTVTGLTEALDIDEIWFTLHSAHRFDTTVDDFINTLKVLGKGDEHFSHIAVELETAQNRNSPEDIDFLNGYLSMARMSLLEVYATTLENLNGRETIDFSIQNRDSWGTFGIFDTIFRRAITISDTKDVDDLMRLYGELIAIIGDDVAPNSKQLMKELLEYRVHNKQGELMSKALSITTASKGESLPLTQYKALTFDLASQLNPKGGKHSDLIAEKLTTGNGAVILDQILQQLDINVISKLEAKDIQKIAYNVIHIAESILRNAFFNHEESFFDSASYAMGIAMASAHKGIRPTKFDYLNVDNNSEFSLNQPFYLSDVFRGLNDPDDDKVRRRIDEEFLQFTKDPRGNFSNWLWHQLNVIGEDGTQLLGTKDKATGIFQFSSESRLDRKLAKDNNPDYVREMFGLASFNGLKFIEHKLGLKADKIVNNTYDLIALSTFLLSRSNAANKYSKDPLRASKDIQSEQGFAYYTIPMSDSPRTILMKAPRFNVLNDLDTSSDVLKLDRTSTTFKALQNIIYQDLNELFTARDTIFNRSKAGKLTVRNQYDPKNKNNNIASDLHAIKHLKQDKQGNITLLDSKGNPTGKVFHASTMSYKTKDGKVVTLFDYLKEKANALEAWKYETLEQFVNAFQDEINDFIEIATQERVTKDMERLAPLQKTFDDYHQREKLNRRSTQKLVTNDKDWQHKMFDFSINQYIVMNEVGNLFGGALSEYDTGIELNKRYAQYAKPGNVPATNREFTTIKVIDPVGKVSEEILEILKQHLSPAQVRKYTTIATADGFSFITIEEYEERMKEVGKYQLFKDIIDALKSDKPLNHYQFSRHLESLKYFYYDRQVKGRDSKMTLDVDNATPYNYAYSTQIKHSAIVLSNNMYVGSQLHDLYKYMRENGIDQLDMSSSQKVTRNVGFKLFDENNNINFNALEDVKPYINIRNAKNLRLQQETKPHMMDEVIKLGVQISKIIFNGLVSDGTYKLNNGNIKGEELFKHFNKLNSANIQSSVLSLLSKWGAVKDGKINRDNNGNILVDTRLITKELRQYVYDEGIDMNLYKSLQPDEAGNSKLPIWAPISHKKLTSILLSKFTKNVITQKLPGIHAPIIPNILVNKSQMMSDADVGSAAALGEIVQDNSALLEEFGITFTNEENELCAAQGLTDGIKGKNWKVVKEFKGKSHAEGGIDIKLNSDGWSFRSGGKDIKAKYGLLIPNN